MPAILLKAASMFAHRERVKGFVEEIAVPLQMAKTQNIADKSLQ
jgi:hypothetical protein